MEWRPPTPGAEVNEAGKANGVAIMLGAADVMSAGATRQPPTSLSQTRMQLLQADS